MSWHRLVGRLEEVLTLVVELACVVAAVDLEVPAGRAVLARLGTERRICCAGPAPSSAVRLGTANAADAGVIVSIGNAASMTAIGNAASMTAIGLVVGDCGVGRARRIGAA